MSSDFVGDDDFPPAEESDPASDLSSKILSEDGDDVEPVEKSTEDEELESDNEGQQAEDGSSQKDSQLIVDDEDEGGEQQREQETEEGEGEGDKSKEDEEIEESKEDNEPDSIGDDLESGDEGEEAQDGRVKKKRRLIVDDDDDEDEDGEKGDPESEESKEDDEANESLGKSIGTLLSEDEDEGTEGTEEAEDGRSKKKRRLIVEDDEEDEDGEKEDKEDDDLLEKSNEDEAEAEGEAEGGGGEVEAEGLDDGEGEGEGEGDAEGEEAGGTSKMKDPAVPDLSSDEESDDDGKRRSKVPDDFVYDFDLMMARKKEESYRSRKRKNIDIINDNDDIIADLITQMKQSADEDFELNKNRKAATCKLRLLPVVETQLRKIDLRESFLDAGVLGVITDWLTPLPDRSLPNLQVRETMLKLLGEFNIMDVERLKASGIGKAVMYLFKHPKETKDNKKRAGVLISSWSRPIFSLDTDFHSMSKEEREQRDFDHMTKLTENKRGRTEPKTPPSSSRKGQAESEKTLRPGDKGWIPRARVPAPSTRDYVVRPKSTVDSEMSKSGSKKAITRLDKHLRNFREKKKLMKTQRAVPISIEGRRMTL